jgi:mono/diheme cytochrome c family protein
MKQRSKNKTYYFPVKTIFIITIILSVIVISTSAFKEENNFTGNTNQYDINTDSVESVQAFMQVYKVLMSPRCMNCHPAGNRPLQGDDSHTHIMNVQRGKDGKGVYALKCSNCHQPTNVSGLHTPPGNPKWQLPPAGMKMVFQGKTAHELALQIMDYNTNGHKNKEQLLEHARDTLVKAGWNMGEGRTPPPLDYDAFVTAWDTWINKGGYAPKP